MTLLHERHASRKLRSVSAGSHSRGLPHQPSDVMIAPGELRVSVMGIRRARMWRQVIGCLVAYAFALQVVLLGFGAPVAAPVADQEALTAALCLHDAGAPPAPADKAADEHCKLCTAGAHQAFTAPAAAQHAIVRTAETAALPATDAFAPPARTHASAQPRGPPPTA